MKKGLLIKRLRYFILELIFLEYFELGTVTCELIQVFSELIQYCELNQAYNKTIARLNFVHSNANQLADLIYGCYIKQ